MSEVVEIPLAKITGFLFEFRLEDELDPEFVASIEKHGVKVPILVRLHNSGYQGIDGRRRFLACKKLGKQTILATIEEMDDQAAFELALIANIQRKSLTPYEEGRAYHEYQDRGWSLRRLAKRANVSYVTIKRRIDLFKTLQKTGVTIGNSKRPESAIAREISQIEDPKAARALIEEIKEHDLSYEETRQARKLVQEEKKPVKEAVGEVLKERGMKEDAAKIAKAIAQADRAAKREKRKTDPKLAAQRKNYLALMGLPGMLEKKTIFCSDHPDGPQMLVWKCCGKPVTETLKELRKKTGWFK